jgi:hypothetical protein
VNNELERMWKEVVNFVFGKASKLEVGWVGRYHLLSGKFRVKLQLRLGKQRTNQAGASVTCLEVCD